MQCWLQLCLYSCIIFYLLASVSHPHDLCSGPSLFNVFPESLFLHSLVTTSIEHDLCSVSNQKI